MKTFNRLCVALFSSLLLTAGLTRAAERLDPLSQQLADSEMASNPGECATTPCALPCVLNARPLTVSTYQLR